jgi:hypothetical protein
MPYILNKTNGTVLTTLGDGTINQSTSLTFVGKNYAGYGEFVNENLLKLLENFSNNTQPAKPLTGQTWYDSVNKKLKIFNGSIFQTFPFTETSSTPPKNLNNGDLWFNTSESKLYVRDTANPNQYTLIGPSTAAITNSGVTQSVVADESSSTQYIIKFTPAGTLAATVSNRSFIPYPNETTLVDHGFPRIKQGITLPGVDINGISQTGYQFWGTAATANNLTDGTRLYPVSYFQPANALLNNVSSGIFDTSDDGIVVGLNRVFRFHANSQLNEGKISVVNGTRMSLNLRYPTITDNTTTIVTILGNTNSAPPYTNPALIPGDLPGMTVDIGAQSLRFGTVYANTLTGAVYGNVYGDVLAVNVTATNMVTTNLSANLVSINGGGISNATISTSTVNGITVGSNASGSRTVETIALGIPANTRGANGDIIYQY